VVRLADDRIELRPLPQTDLPELLRIYHATPAFFAAIGGAAERLTLQDVLAQWRAAQASGRALLGVYLSAAGRLIGVADVQVGAPREEAAALWLLIEASAQRRGYGQACMALIEAWLIPDAGVRTLCAAAGSNADGLSFLELQGFQITDEPAPPPVGEGQAIWACW
jgi:GNAT superfamily N-acetyltransferase